MEEETTSTESPKSTGRRRASRAAGPHGEVTASTGVPVGRTEDRQGPVAQARRPAAAPATAPVAGRMGVAGDGGRRVGRLGGGRPSAVKHQDGEEAKLAHTQRFVDTATQTVVNMFSFKQDTVDESVDRFYDGTSGPLRDMFSQGNNVANLKAIFRDTGASSETVINGAALESIDDISDNARCLCPRGSRPAI